MPPDPTRQGRQQEKISTDASAAQRTERLNLTPQPWGTACPAQGGMAYDVSRLQLPDFFLKTEKNSEADQTTDSFCTGLNYHCFAELTRLMEDSSVTDIPTEIALFWITSSSSNTSGW